VFVFSMVKDLENEEEEKSFEEDGEEIGVDSQFWTNVVVDVENV